MACKGLQGIESCNSGAFQRIWIDEGPGRVFSPVDTVGIDRGRMDARFSFQRDSEAQEKLGIPAATPGRTVTDRHSSLAPRQ
ncbi:hypothetical protein SAMN04490244_107202 [Tranquillimonas rosea]|uniref:Uncharacterized protein n=1 Tax=Tranquillimonas rosea TaxID=641238 RepID=A0A1H9VLV9_9RHOB|nr:hypothetical protein SAMN04490244_107202 [Tranquillimonas rosea]